MTKEEIYLKHVGKGTNVRSVFYQRCLDAMEEYAEKSRQVAVGGSLPDIEIFDLYLIEMGIGIMDRNSIISFLYGNNR